LLPVAVLYTAVLALWLGPAQRWPHLGFYLVFAVTVTASVQLVDGLLVFAGLLLFKAKRNAPPDQALRS
jgi:zinc/manganese transport system permease protein